MFNRTGMQNRKEKLSFGDFRLDRESRTLWRGGKEIHLPKRPFQVLDFLIDNRERVVGRDELLDKFWDGHEVYDDALRKTVGAVRNALDDTNKPPCFIETRYGMGYRFIGAVDIGSRESEFESESEPSLATGGLNSANSQISDFKLQNENERPKNEDYQSNSEFKNRYVLIAASIVSVLFFVSLGFYVYFPNGNENPPTKNLVEAVVPVRSIGVLPIKNLTGDASSEYFSDGITESIITELSRIKELRVISSSSTFALKGKEIDPREIKKKTKC